MPTTDHAFLLDLDRRLWTMADRLRSNLDAAVYKHAVLGLIFRKSVSMRERTVACMGRADPPAPLQHDGRLAGA